VSLKNEAFDPQDAAKVYDDTADKALLDFDYTELTNNVLIQPGDRTLFFDSNRQKENTCGDAGTERRPHEDACSWPDTLFQDALLYEIVSKDVCRRFLLEVEKHRTLQNIEDKYDSTLELHTICTECIACRPGPLTMIAARDFVRSYLVRCLLDKKTFNVHPNTQWMTVQCLLLVCPVVEQGAFPPLFSVEEVGRDGWALTTYGLKPMRHVMFPDVALRMRSETGLLYTVLVHQEGGRRRLGMLGVSAQV
jgi:hypothetical protein